MLEELRGGQWYRGPKDVGAWSSCTAEPHEGELWLLAPMAHPTRLIPYISSHTADPTRLVPHGSLHTAHPTRLILPGSPHTPAAARGCGG